MMSKQSGLGPRKYAARVVRMTAVVAAATSVSSVMAMELSDGDVKVNWDNSLKYSLGARTAHADSVDLANPNVDDGDRNFSKGSLVTNRLDVLSEFDARYKTYGLSISGAGWYDDVYNQHTDNNSATTYNPFSVSSSKFPAATRAIAGHHAELRNAFVTDQFDAGGVPVTARFGRHVVLWGESLFFSDNGIAAGMAPVDAFNALSVPSIQAKEVFLPVNQLSTVAAISETITVEGFYQLEWRRTRIPPAGTFLSSVDLLDVGGERLIAEPGAYFYRNNDVTPKKKQFGLAVKWRPKGVDTDFGFYALRYDDKVPQLYLTPGVGRDGTIFNPGVVDLARGQIGAYQLSYKEGIWTYGLSANTSWGDTNLGAEVSYRHGIPLVSNSPVLLPGASISNSHPLYAVGDTLHYQVSAIYVGKAGPAWDSVSFAGEVAGHHLVKTTENAAARSTATQDDALGFRGVLGFDYYQVAPGLDLSVPITVGWNFKGLSPITPNFNNYGSHHGGDVGIGLTGTYHTTWKGGINYTHFAGKAAENVYTDRSFVTLNVSTSF